MTTTTATTTAAIPLGVLLSHWWAGVKADDAQLQLSLTAVETAKATTGGTAINVNRACESLIGVAQKLQRDAPAPTPTMNALWQAALTDYSTAGTMCEAATVGGTFTTPEMANASAFMARALSETAQVMDEIKSQVPGA